MPSSNIDESENNNTTSAGRRMQTSCTHARLVDEVLTEEGAKTGRLICKECKAVISDPRGQPPTGD